MILNLKSGVLTMVFPAVHANLNMDRFYSAGIPETETVAGALPGDKLPSVAEPESSNGRLHTRQEG